MKNSKWRNKRNRAGISIYTMAKELGISYEKMLEIDRGERDLNGEYIEKFNEVISNALIINDNRKERMYEVRNYFMSDEPKKDLKKLHYTQKDLQPIFNVSANITAKLFNKRLEHISDDILERFYGFLHNYMNKQIEHKEEVVENPIETPIEETSSEESEVSTENVCESKLFICNDDGKYTELAIEEPSLEEEQEEPVEQSTEYQTINACIAPPLDETIKQLEDKIKKLEHQIVMYEKLIERL